MSYSYEIRIEVLDSPAAKPGRRKAAKKKKA